MIDAYLEELKEVYYDRYKLATLSKLLESYEFDKALEYLKVKFII